jgi:hypothetical protein
LLIAAFLGMRSFGGRLANPHRTVGQIRLSLRFPREFTDVRGTVNLSANLTVNFFQHTREQRTIPGNRLLSQEITENRDFSRYKEQ